MGNENTKPKPKLNIGSVVGNEDNLKEIEKILQSCTIQESKQLENKMETWQDVAINVCLLGESGAGKSCFINNMTGTKLAEVGVIETTKDAMPFPHPNKEKLVFWDLPGYGCDLYPTIGDYIDSMNMRRFDIIIFLHKDRFKKNDSNLLTEIIKVGKPFFLVRSNFDKDIQKIKVEDAKRIVRKDLETCNLPDSIKCYCICNHSMEFDYEELMKNFLAVVNELQLGFETRYEKLLPGDAVTGKSDYLKEMKAIIAEYNFEDARLKIREKLDAWKQVAVNVCLLGESGVGKSSFINNMAGQKLAKVGITETTQTQRSYPHPDNEKLVFWDLPGFGCHVYKSIKSYIEAMDMNRFDIILFLYKSRFKKDDDEVVKEIEDIGKPFFVIRSMFDMDIQGGHVEGVKNTIQSDFTKHMSNGNNTKCYFISNLSRDHDYEDLMKELFTALDNSTKEQVLAFTLGSSNEAIIKIKKKQLKKRIWFASTAAAGIGAIPVPGVDVVLNTGLIVEESIFMAKVLGILEDVRNNKDACFKKCARYITVAGVTTILKVAAPIAADEVFKFILPVVGSVISSGISFAVTKYTLDKILLDLIKATELKLEREYEVTAQFVKKGDF